MLTLSAFNILTRVHNKEKRVSNRAPPPPPKKVGRPCPPFPAPVSKLLISLGASLFHSAGKDCTSQLAVNCLSFYTWSFRGFVIMVLQILLITPLCACASRGQVIALGLDYIVDSAKKGLLFRCPF